MSESTADMPVKIEVNGDDKTANHSDSVASAGQGECGAFS